MKTQNGFSLIELAIVLVIVTILIGGLAVPLSAQIEARRIGETKKTLEEAREAIFGYAMSNSVTSTCACNYQINPISDGVSDSTDCPATVSCPVITTPIPSSDTTLTLTIPTRHYLPCPDKLDDGNPATTKDGDGIEETRVGGACPQSEGYLPWVTLGTGNQDAWGNHLLYAVRDIFSNSAGFSNTDTGDLQICNTSANTGTSDCGALGNVAGKVPVVLVSYGPNGWGARNINGNKLADPSSNNEKENANTDTVDKEFVSRTPSKAGAVAGEFDDLVVWISSPLLFSRVCPSGGCP